MSLPSGEKSDTFGAMNRNPKAEEQRLLARVNYAIKHDSFPLSQIEGLARRIANHTPCTLAMVKDYLSGVRSLGHYEREAF